MGLQLEKYNVWTLEGKCGVVRMESLYGSTSSRNSFSDLLISPILIALNLGIRIAAKEIKDVGMAIACHGKR